MAVTSADDFSNVDVYVFLITFRRIYFVTMELCTLGK
jgi:hypothetical protein